MGFAIGYSIFLSALAILILLTAIKALRKKELFGVVLGIGCLLTFLSTGAYLVSALSNNELLVRVFGNLYFGTVTLILTVFVFVNTLFTKKKFNLPRIVLFGFIAAFALYESVAFIINIDKSFIIEFVRHEPEGIIPYFEYKMFIPFYFHLSFSYLVVAIIMFQLIRCIIKTPSGYRRAYVSVLVALSIAVVANAFFLFLGTDHVIARYDTSLPGYYILAFLIYWAYFHYTKTGLVSVHKNFIMNNIEQGFVMFNYEEKLIYCNENAKRMLQGIDLSEGLNLKAFKKSLGFDLNKKVTRKPVTSQITVKNGDERRTLRVTSSALFNKKEQAIGFLFTFYNTEFESDVLTSFESNAAFMAKLKDSPNIFQTDMTLSVLDINNLSSINSQNGYAEGDVAIQDLSNLIRRYFPTKGSYYVRGREASLAVFCEGICEEDAMDICKTINSASKYTIQYAVTIVRGNENIIDGIYRVRDSLNTRKVMDEKSQRSGSLNSLVKALQEVDSDTSNHVKRTQLMADKLAEKLGLNQVDKNNLLLLSILHDIGKISIPLEILNKPTKLTEEEWIVMKSHTTKGYNIAMSSPLLKGIANEILYHHERWDGKGYPEGLSGENIPLLSRIVSVVDSYDAMVSDRVYRRGMSTNSAIQELIRCSGTQFDPNIVKQFIEVLEQNKFVYTRNEQAEKSSNEKKIEIKQSDNINPLSYSRYTIANGDDIVYIDANFTNITGYTREDIENGLTQSSLIPIEDRIAYTETIKKTMRENNVVVIEHRLQKKDGTIITVFCYGKKYFNSAVREFRDEIMIFDTANSKAIKDYLELQRTISEK